MLHRERWFHSSTKTKQNQRKRISGNNCPLKYLGECERRTREWFSRLRKMKNKSWDNFSKGHEIHILSGGVVTRTEHSRNPGGSSKSRSLCLLMHDLGCLVPRHQAQIQAPEQICITFDRRKECTSGTRGRACSSCRHWPRGFAPTQRSGVSCRAQDARVEEEPKSDRKKKGTKGYKRERR